MKEAQLFAWCNSEQFIAYRLDHDQFFNRCHMLGHLETHRSDNLATYISVSGFIRFRAFTRIHRTNWGPFKETLELACHSGELHESFEQLITTTMTEVTQSFSVRMKRTRADAEYQDVRAISGGLESQSLKTEQHKDINA